MNLSGWVAGYYVYRSLAGLNGKPYVSEPEQLFIDNSDIEYRTKEEDLEVKTNQAADGFRAFAIMFNRERDKKRKEVEMNGEHRYLVDRTNSVNSESVGRVNEVNIEAEHTE